MKQALTSLFSLVCLAVSAQAFSVKVRLDLDPGDTFRFESNGNLFNGFLSIGTFDGTQNFATDSVSVLFSKWLPANGGAQVNTADDQQQLTPDISSQGTATTVTGGVFAPAIRTSTIGNNNVFDNDPDPAPTSFYNTEYEGSGLFLWVSSSNAANLGSSTTYSIFNTGLAFDDRFNVANGFSQINVDVNNTGLINVRDNGVALVPEPSSIMLLAGALSTMALRRRRA